MTEKIILAGGCFWCTEAVLQRVEGITKVTSGYANGNTINPTYQEVCSELTGFAEAVEVLFSLEKISLEKILTIFFATHDPTTLNQQGHDIGTRYRSGVFYITNKQKDIIAAYIKQLQTTLEKPIVTQIEPLQNFYKAEAYHQNFYNLNKTTNSYCRFVIDPKIKKLQSLLEN